MSGIHKGEKEITDAATFADKLLFLVLIMASVLGFVFLKKAFPHGADVIINLDGKPAYKLPLDTNRTVLVKGPIGDTLVEVKDGKVRIKESPCPNKICIHNGWTDNGTIICIPNKVTVKVEGSAVTDPQKNERDKIIDAISG